MAPSPLPSPPSSALHDLGEAGLLPSPQVAGQPLTALAPMQDVTDLAFMRVIAHYGAPDYFFTEFFRVHAQSKPEKHILRSIDENTTGRPVFAQLIGEDLGHLARTAAELLQQAAALPELATEEEEEEQAPPRRRRRVMRSGCIVNLYCRSYCYNINYNLILLINIA